jgi:hypothetical protein
VGLAGVAGASWRLSQVGKLEREEFLAIEAQVGN